MFDHSNTPGTVRAEDQTLVKAINDARRWYRFSAATAEQLFDDFTKPKPELRQWIFELCDPCRRASPFTTDDELAAFTREVSTKGKGSARWADLTIKERRLAWRIKRFVQDRKRVWMGAGRPQNVDRTLIFYVIRLIEERTGVKFRFSRPQPLYFLGGPMLLLVEAALHRLFGMFDRTAGYLGLVSPARHYKRDEIARTAKLVRRASRASSTSPANWPSDLILDFRGEVGVELAGKNKDRGSASPSWPDIAALRELMANPWVDLEEGLKLAASSERQTPSGLDLLQANLKSGAQPDLIELAKGKMPRDDQ